MGKLNNVRSLKEKFQRSRNRHHTTITVPSRCTSLVRFATGVKISLKKKNTNKCYKVPLLAAAPSRQNVELLNLWFSPS